MFFLDRDRDQNIFDWDRHQNLFLKGPGPRPKTFFRRDQDRDRNFFLPGPEFFSCRERDEFFFSPGPVPKMTGPAHVYSRSSLSLHKLTAIRLFSSSLRRSLSA